MRGYAGLPYPAVYKTWEQRMSDRAFQDQMLYAAAGVLAALYVLRWLWGKVFGLHRSSVGSEYDYIVVGSGASGCVVANRLATRGSTEATVLLLEAGDDDRAHDMTLYPSYAYDLPGTAVDWKHDVRCAALGDRALGLPAGKVLGGSSAIDENIYQRPPKKEFEVFERTGVKGWSYADCLPFFRRSEKAIVDEKAAHHGLSGELPVGFTFARSPVGKLSVDSADAVGVAKKYDANAPEPAVGVSPCQAPVSADGRRCSAATAFVRPILKQKNFTCRTRAEVTRVIFEGSKATGVEWRDVLGRTHTTRCAKEVVLCAGAVNTPAILLRSDLPRRPAALGKNLRDLCTVPLVAQARRGVTFDSANIHNLVQTMAYKMSGQGPIVSHPADTIAYLDSKVHQVQVSWPDQKALEEKPDKLSPKEMKAKAKGATSDTLVVVSNRGGYRRREFEQRKLSKQIGWFQEGVTFFVTKALDKAAVPDASCGEVRVEGEAVKVELGLAAGDEELQRLAVPLRMVRRMAATSPLKSLLTQREAIDTSLLADVPADEAADLMYGKAAARRVRNPRAVRPEEFEALERIHAEIDSDAYLTKYARAHAAPFGAPVGTCSMAPVVDGEKVLPPVVDSQTLLLDGAENVRIADTSVLPLPMLAPGTAMALMVGERAANMILYGKPAADN